MNGKELYLKYVSQRDYSGSEADKYAQLLQTVFYQIDADIFPLLEKAENEEKKLTVTPEALSNDEIVTSDLVLA